MLAAYVVSVAMAFVAYRGLQRRDVADAKRRRLRIVGGVLILAVLPVWLFLEQILNAGAYAIALALTLVLGLALYWRSFRS
jgi:Flp pilus assembly protein protease CpaA